MRIKKYNSSVYCHCFAKETLVHLYGSFDIAFGECTICGAKYTAIQTPTGDNNTRYDVKKDGGRIGEAVTFVRDFIKIARVL